MRVRPDPATANHLARVVHGPVLTWFAPFHPSADGVRVVQAFAHLVTHRRPDAYLVATGRLDDASHLATLQAYVVELVLDRCWLLPDPTAAQLVAFAERAVLHLDPCVVHTADARAGRRLRPIELGDALADLLPAPASVASSSSMGSSASSMGSAGSSAPSASSVSSVRVVSLAPSASLASLAS